MNLFSKMLNSLKSSVPWPLAALPPLLPLTWVRHESLPRVPTYRTSSAMFFETLRCSPSENESA